MSDKLPGAVETDPMAILTAIFGLCGSGKTHLATRMAGAHVIEGHLFARLDELFATLLRGRDCVVTEIALCLRERRGQFTRLVGERAPGTVIVWVPIENDLQKANRNCRRPELVAEYPDYEADGHVCLNEGFHQMYEYPEGVAVLPMWPYGAAWPGAAPADSVGTTRATAPG